MVSEDLFLIASADVCQDVPDGVAGFVSNRAFVGIRTEDNPASSGDLRVGYKPRSGPGQVSIESLACRNDIVSRDDYDFVAIEDWEGDGSAAVSS